jgi:sec-independent protein translocase protein TatC
MPDQSFTIKDHLDELRRRLIICVSWFAGAFVICYAVSDYIVSILFFPVKEAMPQDTTMVFTALTEGFMAYLKVAFWSALVLTSPVLLYNLWKFLLPALYDHEKAVFRKMLFWGTGLFVAGGIFGYWMIMPVVLSITMGFASEQLQALPRLQNYLLFTLKAMFTFGLIFEIPFLMAGATRLGLVPRGYFRKNRKMAYLALYLLAVFLVPSDIFSQLLLLMPLVAIYEIGVLLGGRTDERSQGHR